VPATALAGSEIDQVPLVVFRVATLPFTRTSCWAKLTPEIEPVTFTVGDVVNAP